MNLIIDIGNTIAKIALFKDNTIVKLFYSSNKYLEGFETILSSYPISQAIVATVIDLTAEIEEQLNAINVPLLRLNHTTLLPITNLYKSPETLGYDRIASVVAAQELHPGKDILVVDAGTCITYEFLDSKGQYHGGNISPGVNMRLKALNHFTSRLPLVEWTSYPKMMGEDTESAILSGVRKGIEFEILGYIKELQQKFPSLLVFLTGGDEFSFDTNLKNIIFADRFLVLKGLNRILNYNNDKD